jgi:hypothetical protein
MSITPGSVVSVNDETPSTGIPPASIEPAERNIDIDINSDEEPFIESENVKVNKVESTLKGKTRQDLLSMSPKIYNEGVVEQHMDVEKYNKNVEEMNTENADERNDIVLMTLPAAVVMSSKFSTTTFLISVIVVLLILIIYLYLPDILGEMNVFNLSTMY